MGAVGSSPDFPGPGFHDIWLLGVCLEILFSSASNLPNSSKSFNTTVPSHIVPMYFKCSVHCVSGNAVCMRSGISVMSRRLGHPKFLWQKIIKFWGIRHLKFKKFQEELPQTPPPPPENVTPPF